MDSHGSKSLSRRVWVDHGKSEVMSGDKTLSDVGQTNHPECRIGNDGEIQGSHVCVTRVQVCVVLIRRAQLEHISHSARNACIGSTEAARRAGSAAAKNIRAAREQSPSWQIARVGCVPGCRRGSPTCGGPPIPIPNPRKAPRGQANPLASRLTRKCAACQPRAPCGCRSHVCAVSLQTPAGCKGQSPQVPTLVPPSFRCR
jgi:hypothetical protein